LTMLFKPSGEGGMSQKEEVRSTGSGGVEDGEGMSHHVDIDSPSTQPLLGVFHDDWEGLVWDFEDISTANRVRLKKGELVSIRRVVKKELSF